MAATDRQWAFGFLEQGRADLESARALSAKLELTMQRASVFAMLLQMSFEKLGKAALLRSGMISYAKAKASHRAASRMIAAMRLQKRLIAPLGGPHQWSAVFEVVETLERAHPVLAGEQPMLEYPWEVADGTVHWPAKHLPIAEKLAHPASTLAAHVLDFASKLERRFDDIFP